MYDLYHSWLGIPARRRPLTPEQLLGVRRGERDPAILEQAALRRSAQLRPYQLKYAAETSRLLCEIAQALNILLGLPPAPPRFCPPPKREPPASRPAANTSPQRRTPPRHDSGTAPPDSGRVKLLVICQEHWQGELTAWQLNVQQVPLSPTQRKDLGNLVRNRRTVFRGVRARIVAEAVPGIPARVLGTLVHQGLVRAKHAPARAVAGAR